MTDSLIQKLTEFAKANHGLSLEDVIVIICQHEAVSNEDKTYPDFPGIVGIGNARLREDAQREMRVIAEGSPKTDCPFCGSGNLDCEDDAPAFHVHCNGCGTHFDNQDGFAFFDRRPPAREIVAVSEPYDEVLLDDIATTMSARFESEENYWQVAAGLLERFKIVKR